jgi:hypothetical protein
MYKHTYRIHSTYIPYGSACPQEVQLYTIQDEVVSPLTPTKFTVLSGNFVFDLHDFDLCNVFQKRNPGIK